MALEEEVESTNDAETSRQQVADLKAGLLTDVTRKKAIGDQSRIKYQVCRDCGLVMVTQVFTGRLDICRYEKKIMWMF